MKIIKAVPMWNNGKSIEATLLNTFAVNVLLGEFATFWWGILDAELNQIQQGNITMSGEDYKKWGNDDQYAWEYVAKFLNLTITGDYVPPVVEQEFAPVVTEIPNDEIITE
jgi:hypothetical protein